MRIHTHEKPYKCTHCFRAFAVKSTLTAHLKTHLGIKEFRCNVCEKMFSTHGSLKVHLRLHTGEDNSRILFLKIKNSSKIVNSISVNSFLRAVGILFSPMVSGLAGGQRKKVCPGCISETVRCRKLILGRDIGLGGVGVQRHGVTLI